MLKLFSLWDFVFVHLTVVIAIIIYEATICDIKTIKARNDEELERTIAFLDFALLFISYQQTFMSLNAQVRHNTNKIILSIKKTKVHCNLPAHGVLHVCVSVRYRAPSA